VDFSPQLKFSTLKKSLLNSIRNLPLCKLILSIGHFSRLISFERRHPFGVYFSNSFQVYNHFIPLGLKTIFTHG